MCYLLRKKRLPLRLSLGHCELRGLISLCGYFVQLLELNCRLRFNTDNRSGVTKGCAMGITELDFVCGPSTSLRPNIYPPIIRADLGLNVSQPFGKCFPWCLITMASSWDLGLHLLFCQGDIALFL